MSVSTTQLAHQNARSSPSTTTSMPTSKQQQHKNCAWREPAGRVIKCAEPTRCSRPGVRSYRANTAHHQHAADRETRRYHCSITQPSTHKHIHIHIERSAYADLLTDEHTDALSGVRVVITVRKSLNCA